MKNESTESEIEKLTKKAAEGINKFLELSESGLRSIAEYGWYINELQTMGSSTFLMEKAINGDVEFLDKYFSDYYKENLERLTKIIINNQESRSGIITEAIACHEEKKYYASTILFLSLADGICNGLLFTTKRNKESLRKYLAKNDNGSLITILLGMITNESTIDEGYSKKEKNEKKLNRHSVVHGLEIHFGTEINSLKAFSLLSYVSGFINRFKEN